MDFQNKMSLSFSSKSENEAFARISVAAFVSQLDPTIAEIMDIKTAVSEAVTNAIIHGYENNEGTVYIKCGYTNCEFYIEIYDKGIGIDNIEQARQPLFTSKPELERSGMGFTVMENFMDTVTIISEPGKGTKVTMTKCLKKS